MSDETKNTQNGNYQEFHSEKTINDFMEKNSPDFSLKAFYGGKCFCVYCCFTSISVLLLIFGFCLLLVPYSGQNYINNIRLRNLFADWNNYNYSQAFANYTIELKVPSSSLYIDLLHLDYEPFYLTQTYYKPSLFYLNFSNSTENEDLSNLQEKMGTLDLTKSKGIIQEASVFCMSFAEAITSNTSIFKSNFTDFGDLPTCIINGKVQTGLKIEPWQLATKENMTQANCTANNGVYYKDECYTYSILETICFEVSIDSNKSLTYKKGCYENFTSSSYTKYVEGKLGNTYNFSDFSIYVRHYKDPYIILMNFFQTEDTSSNFFSINYDIREKIIPGSIFFGAIAFAFSMMIYLLLKSEVQAKFKLL